MTALSNLFAWIWLLFPGPGQAPPTTQSVQPCSAPVEQVCPPAAQETQEKEGFFRQLWKNGRENGISNGI